MHQKACASWSPPAKGSSKPRRRYADSDGSVFADLYHDALSRAERQDRRRAEKKANEVTQVERQRREHSQRMHRHQQMYLHRVHSDGDIFEGGHDAHLEREADHLKRRALRLQQVAEWKQQRDALEEMAECTFTPMLFTRPEQRAELVVRSECIEEERLILEGRAPTARRDPPQQQPRPRPRPRPEKKEVEDLEDAEGGGALPSFLPQPSSLPRRGHTRGALTTASAITDCAAAACYPEAAQRAPPREPTIDAVPDDRSAATVAAAPAPPPPPLASTAAEAPAPALSLPGTPGCPPPDSPRPPGPVRPYRSSPDSLCPSSYSRVCSTTPQVPDTASVSLPMPPNSWQAVGTFAPPSGSGRATPAGSYVPMRTGALPLSTATGPPKVAGDSFVALANPASVAVGHSAPGAPMPQGPAAALPVYSGGGGGGGGSGNPVGAGAGSMVRSPTVGSAVIQAMPASVSFAPVRGGSVAVVVGSPSSLSFVPPSPLADRTNAHATAFVPTLPGGGAAKVVPSRAGVLATPRSHAPASLYLGAAVPAMRLAWQPV